MVELVTIERPGAYKPVSPVPGGVAANGFAWLSGLMAVDLDTGEISDGNVTRQTHMTFDYIERTLENAGCQLDQVVRVWVYLTCQADFDGFNAVYRERFRGHQPARTCVVVAALRDPRLRIEIDVVAAQEASRS